MPNVAENVLEPREEIQRSGAAELNGGLVSKGGILLTEIWIAAFLKIFGLPFCVVQLTGPGVGSAL